MTNTAVPPYQATLWDICHIIICAIKASGHMETKQVEREPLGQGPPGTFRGGTGSDLYLQHTNLKGHRKGYNNKYQLSRNPHTTQSTKEPNWTGKLQWMYYQKTEIPPRTQLQTTQRSKWGVQCCKVHSDHLLRPVPTNRAEKPYIKSWTGWSEQF